VHLLLLTQHDISVPRDNNSLRVAALAVQFCAEGNSVSVIRFKRENESPSSPGAPFPVHDLPLPRGSGPAPLATLNHLMDKDAEKLALTLNKSKRIDMVQSDVSWAALSGIRIARKLHVPHVFLPHECETMLAKQLTDAVQARRGQISGTPLADLNMSVVQWAEKRAVEGSALMLAPSVEQIGEMASVGIKPHKVEVFPNGTGVYPLTREARMEMKAYLGLWLETPTAVFMGRQDNSACMEAAEFICRQIAPRCPGVIFMIVGLNMPRLGVPSNVLVVGPVDRIDMYLGAADIEIMPLLSGESASMRILDAWAAGLPVISTSLGAANLRYSDGTNILIEDDMSRFPSRVMGLLTQPQLLQKLAAGALEAAYPFRWEVLGKRYTQSLQALSR
jgi:glycosyltransferase involved in cell wall biosynthesis